MFQKASVTNHTTNSFKKCPRCKLINFADRTLCTRCKSDLALPMTVAKNARPTRNASILAALVVVLFGLVVFYMHEGPEGTPDLKTEAIVAPAPAPSAEKQEQTATEQNAQSEDAAARIVISLKDFQDATESGMDFDEYDKKLNSLETDLNSTLTLFVRHEPGDEAFRQEVAAVVRNYTAAGNWWKTTITNGSVFTEADRNERTQKDWASARTHLTNAEQVLVR